MKIENIFKDNIELSVKQKQQKQHELLGHIRPHDNHTLFEVNTITNIIKKAEFSQATAIVFGEEIKKEVIIINDCVYVSALNKKSAIKKYLKEDNGSKKQWINPIKFFQS